MIEEMMAKLTVKKGEALNLAESPHGDRLTSYIPAFERQIELVKHIMPDDAQILKALSVNRLNRACLR